jgi:predicted Zn finger-like uncharacterized protein
MILTCPLCTTRYLADAKMFAPPGRNVRCAKCGQVWFQAPAGPESEPEPEPIVDKVEKQASSAFAAATEMRYTMAAAPRRSAGGMFANAVGWLALILLVLALGGATVKYRQTIASLWPQSATLYAALGMPVNLRGLEFAGVTYSDQLENGEPVLAVSGKLVNVTSHEIPVPAIRVSLSDNDKRELYHWTFASGISTLAPGARGSFSTRLASPPSEARHVEVRFARAGE